MPIYTSNKEKNNTVYNPKHYKLSSLHTINVITLSILHIKHQQFKVVKVVLKRNSSSCQAFSDLICKYNWDVNIWTPQ